MNPLKTLFTKVFDQAPPKDAANASKEDAAFEWNPEEEAVAPTSAQTPSWKRGGVAEIVEKPEVAATAKEPVVSGHDLPSPTFDRHVETVPEETIAARPTAAPSPAAFDDSPAPTLSSFGAITPAASAPPALPLSDFEDVYRKAGIKSPVHAYGVERVYRLLTSRRLVGLDRSIRRSALLTALDAAGVPISDVSQDAVLRRKALAAYEAEKALELQSLRSRNESRAEALQDTVETFTRQKQSQIERLAQGSTSAVRAQYDLEIRKRMEQDRLYRSLTYFVEPLPTASERVKGSVSETPKIAERFDRTLEMTKPLSEETPQEEGVTPAGEPEVVTLSPDEEAASTKPISLSSIAEADADKSGSKS